MRRLSASTVLLMSLASIEFHHHANAGVLDSMQCVSPSLTSYWDSPAPEGGEVVVAYSANGFFKDLELRLPPHLFSALMDASMSALKENKVKKYAVGVERVTADFYSDLRANLSRLAGLSSDACGIQVQDLIDLVNSRYVYKETNVNTDWYSAMGINNRSVRNDQLLALIGNYQPSASSRCETVYQQAEQRIRVCK